MITIVIIYVGALLVTHSAHVYVGMLRIIMESNKEDPSKELPPPKKWTQTRNIKRVEV